MPAKILPISKIKSDPTLSVSSCPAVKIPPDEAYLNTPRPMLQTRMVHGDGLNSDPNPSLIRKLSPLDADKINSEYPLDRSPLIRFQSHVRISAGVPRTQGTEGDIKADNLSAISLSSSLASSPAPSIYAPLRSESDDEHSRWGSLGRRVNGSGVGKKHRKLRETTERGRQMQIWQYRRYGDDKNERTPLIGHTVQSAHELQNMVGGIRDVNMGNGQSNDEIDFVFGTWPSRLLNRYWWWWRLEPIVCCDCLDDSDTEY